MRQPPEKNSTVHYVLAMIFAVGALYLAAQSFLDFACWGVFPLIALVAWPIWRYQTETTLFQRRAILERVAREDSFIRRWFWFGRIAIASQIFIALGWAILLLALGEDPQPGTMAGAGGGWVISRTYRTLGEPASIC